MSAPLLSAAPESTDSHVPQKTSPPQSTSTPRPLLPTGGLAPLTTANISQVTEQLRIGNGRLNQGVLSPDGSTLAATYWTGIAFLNPQTLEPVRWLNFSQPVHSLSFSPDGKNLAVGMGERGLALVSAETGEERQDFTGHIWEVNCTAFSPDGQYLVSGSMDKTVRIWQVSNGSKFRTFSGQSGSILRVGFIQEGSAVLSASLDGTVRIWRIADGKLLQTLDPQAGRMLAAEISPDGTWLAAGYQNGSLFVWNLLEETAPRALTQAAGNPANWEDWPRALAFSPDSRTLATGGGSGQIFLWEVAFGEPAGQYQAAPSVISLVFTEDGKSLIAGSLVDSLRRFDLASGKLAVWRDPQGFQSGITSLAVSPDGAWIAAGSLTGELKLIQPASSSQLMDLPGHSGAVYGLSFSHDHKFLASGSADGEIRIWQIPSGGLIQTIRTATAIRALAFSPDGKSLAECSELNKEIRIWDLASGAVSKTLKGHLAPVEALAYSPDGKTLFSGSGDHTAILWDLSSGKPLATYKPGIAVLCVALSPNGTLAAYGVASQLVRVIRAQDGKPVASLIGHKDQIAAVAFLGEEVLASSSVDGKIDLWDLSQPKKPLAVLQGHAGTADCIVATPDGTLLISGGDDGTLRFWGVKK